MKTNYTSYKPMTVWTVIVLVVLSLLSFTLACEESMKTIQGDDYTKKSHIEQSSINDIEQSPNNNINIFIKGDDTFYVNTNLASSSNLSSVLQQEMKNKNTKIIIIKSYETGSIKDIEFAMDTAFKVNAEAIGFNIETGKRLESESTRKMIIREPRNTKQKNHR